MGGVKPSTAGQQQDASFLISPIPGPTFWRAPGCSKATDLSALSL